MARYSDEDYGGYSGDHGQYGLEQTKNNSINLLSSLSSVQVKDGKNYYMGMEVAPELASTMQYLTSTYPTYLSDFVREGVYDNSKELFNKLNKHFGISSNPAAGRKAGLYTSAAVTGLLIGLQPIVEIVRSANQSRKDKKQIKEVLSAVIETNKDSYKDNEVIQTIMDNTHKAMVTGFKRAAAELPTVLVNGYYANLSHKDLVKQKTNEDAFKNPAVGDAHRSQLDKDLMDEEAREHTYAQMRKDKPSDATERIIARDKAKYEDLAREQHSEESDKNFEDKHRLLHVNLAAGANIFLKSRASKGIDDEKLPTAYELIIDLQKKINNKEIDQGSNIKEQIIEIFQRNEHDRKRQPMSGGLLEQFNPIAERIAEVISNHELDAIALVSLVGDKKVVSVERHLVTIGKLEQLIDNQRAVFSNHYDDVFSDLANPKAAMKAFEENLANLKGDEKALYTSMFSEKMLKKSKLSKKEIVENWKRGHELFCDFAKSYTAELAKKTDEELKEQGLSSKQIESVKKLNELIVAGDEKGVKSAIGGDESVLSAVRTASMNEQLKTGKKPWAETVRRQDKIIEKPKSSSAAERIVTESQSQAALGL